MQNFSHFQTSEYAKFQIDVKNNALAASKWNLAFSLHKDKSENND